jgi:hypothetical protein
MIIFPTSGTITNDRTSISATLRQQDTLTLPARWDSGAPVDLSGATITIAGTDLDTGGRRQFGGAVTGANGAIEWQLSSGDVGRVVAYEIRFRAVGTDYDIESNPVLYKVLPPYDPESERVIRQVVDGEPVYEVVPMTADEIESRALAQESATDGRLINRLLRQQVDLATIPADEVDDFASLFPVWRFSFHAYVIDNIVQYDGAVYQCIQAHSSQSDWSPPAVPALWVRLAEPGQVEWMAGVAYAVNDEVTYNSVWYRCLQAHTSQVGWEPPNVPALWAVI